MEITLEITRKCACKASYVPLQVMDLQVKYHYYSMHTFQFPRYGPEPKFNQSRRCVKCKTIGQSELNVIGLYVEHCGSNFLITHYII